MDNSNDLIVVPATTLSELAVAINEEHARAVSHAQQAINHALRCGRLLLEAKAQLHHGGFLPWLRDNCDVGERQSRNYMRVADNWPAIQAKSAPGADLTIKGALALLEGPTAKSPEIVTGESGALDVYLQADLLNVGHVYQLDRFRTVLGDLQTQYGRGELHDIDEPFVVQYLAMLRTEDVPVFWFVGIGDDARFQVFQQACLVFDQELTRRDNLCNAADRAAFWWATLAAYLPMTVEQLTDAISHWKERFYAGIAYLGIYPEKPAGPPKTDRQLLDHVMWWGHRSDLRHAGAESWLKPGAMPSSVVLTSIQVSLRNWSLPSSMQRWSSSYERWAQLLEKEEMLQARLPEALQASVLDD